MLRLRGRLGLAMAASVAIALLMVLAVAGPRLAERAERLATTSLIAEARLMAAVVSGPLEAGADSRELDALVDEAAREVRARVTIIAPDGRVLADSALSGEQLAHLENHGSRPEVLEARARGVGSARRHSATLDRDLLYAAVSIRGSSGSLGYSRLALGAEDVEAQAAELRSAVRTALVVAFVVVGALTLALSSSLLRPLRGAMETARRFAAGDLDARIGLRRGDEVGELGQILDQAADQLQDRLEENARERARSEAILSSMEEGVLAVDHRGVVLRANSALRTSLGFEDAVGRSYLEVVRQREVGEVLEAVLRDGERRATEVELRHLGRTFALTGVPFPGTAGSPAGAVLTFHDVTERRRLERIRRDFVANASHELRTPLTSIRGFVEALEDGAIHEPATAARFLGKIRTHADRMTTLIQDLLELSRLESGERATRFEPVDPGEVAQTVVGSFAEQAARSSVGLLHRSERAPSVVSDRDRLQRILEALVDNALKYTPAGGHVEVRTAAGEAGGAVVEVVDDGPGIPSEHLPRLFERFYRVDKARSRELGGTGLGLSIARHLADGMGATVAVSSVVGGGSRFTVTVPPGPQAAPTQAAGADAPPAA